MIALRFERYGFRYSIADRPAIENLSFELPAGKVVSVIAPQGKGKTTILRAAAGLLGEIYQGDVTGSVGDTGDSAAGPYGAVVPMVECRNLAQLSGFVRDLR